MARVLCTKDEILDFIQQCVKHFGTQTALAQDIGISPQYLNDVIHEKREPGKKILDYFGIEKIYNYAFKDKL